MAACWRLGELPSGGAAVEVLSSATVFLAGTAPTQTTAAASESIASEGDEASMAGAQGCLPAKSARERAIGIERSRISEKIVKRS